MKTENRMRRICLLILFLVATAMNVCAEKYKLWVAGVQVTDDNYANIPVGNGTVKFDRAFKILIFKNATVTATGTNGIYRSAVYSEMPKLTIAVSGNSTLTAAPGGCGIACNGSLDIYGGENDTLSVSGPTAIAMTSDEDNTLSIYNDIKLTLDGTSYYGVTSSNSNTVMKVRDSGTEVKTRGVQECYRNLKNIVFNNKLDFIDPDGVSFQDGKVYDATGTPAKNEWVTIADSTVLRHVNITDYTWPTDFEPADYEVSSSTKGVKSISVDYIMNKRTLDNYEGYTGDYLGIRFTVELENGCKFADDVNAYMVQDGSTVTQYSIEDGATASKKSFVFTYRVPTPEGGVYMRTARDTITAPVIGAEPVWEIAAAAGAKAVGAWQEPNAKEQFQRDSYCPVDMIRWWEYKEEDGWELMERGDVFKAGKKYFVEMFALPVSGQQFHDRTVYEVNGEVAKAIDNTPSLKIPTEEGAHYFRVTSGKTNMCYVFPELPYYLGDVNRDGSISMADANMVVNYFLTAEKPTGFPVHLANVNGDYDEDGNPVVTMADANMIVNAFLSGTELQLFDPVNGHEYVDLGLSVKWATCNVGAENPEDYGDHFAWGETTPKDSYSWETYKWCEGSNTTLTKYNSSSNYGTVDNRTTLAPADDAATANWHGAWRMPTKQEQTALRDSCYWEWTRNYNGKGVSGYIVYKAKVNADMGIKKYSGSTTKTSATYSLSDTHIFLPAAGYHEYTDLLFTGSNCDYWSSSLNESGSDYASWRVFCNPDYVKYNSYLRSFGFSVRPVLP